MHWPLYETRSVLKQKASLIPFKPVLGGVELLQFSLVFMNGLNKTESDVILYCRFSLFLKDPVFFRTFRGCNSCRCFCMELVNLHPVYRYGVDIFHVLVLREYWVLTESKLPLKTVLGGA